MSVVTKASQSSATTPRLQGKVAILTGAAIEGSIGATTAQVFVQHGAKVLISDLAAQEAKGKALVKKLGEENAAWVALDVIKEADWANAVKTCLEKFGRIDILFNNAGGAQGVFRVDAEPLEHHEKWMKINVTGVYLGIRAVMPKMKEQQSGSIVNVSSMNGLIGVAGMASYSASKFAVTGMTKSVAMELGPLGIRVNSIHPGIIHTLGLDNLAEKDKQGLFNEVKNFPVKRLGSPFDIAHAALFLASDESMFCCGTSLLVDGGQSIGRFRNFTDDGQPIRAE